MREKLASPLPNQSESVHRSERDNNNRKKKRSKITLPWWCIFVAYGLSFIVFGVSAFFIFARGVEFGDNKTRQWLISSIAGFFSSILFTQPVKVSIEYMIIEKNIRNPFICLYCCP
jgi:hypothetical protein